MEWTGARYADGPTAEVETRIAAAPERVWQLVSDIELMPTLSPELGSVEWLDGAKGPVLGARFVGRNQHDALGEWETTSYVVELDPPRTFAWAVGDPDHPAATWRFSVEPVHGGTVLRQRMQLGPAPSGLSPAIERMPDKEQKIIFNRLRELEANMSIAVEEIRKLAEGTPEANA